MMTFHLRLSRISKPKNPGLKLDLGKLKDPNVLETFQAMIGRKFVLLTILNNPQTWIQWSPPSTQQWLKQPVRSFAYIVKDKKPGSLQKFLIYVIEGENWGRNDLNLKDLRNTGKWITTSRGAWKAKENRTGEQCSEVEGNLRKDNSKRVYQLVKDLTTVKQRNSPSIQDGSGKCLTAELVCSLQSLQFASLYDRQEIFMWSNCLLDLGADFLVGNMVFV